MRRRRWGRLIHLTSLAAKQPIALLTISSTLRAGLSALTKTMSNEFARDGVLVNALLPGHVLTDRQVELNEIRSKQEEISVEEYALRVQGTIPIGRYGQPREIDEVVAFLASERASYLTGATIQVDGGLIQGPSSVAPAMPSPSPSLSSRAFSRRVVIPSEARDLLSYSPSLRSRMIGSSNRNKEMTWL